MTTRAQTPADLSGLFLLKKQSNGLDSEYFEKSFILSSEWVFAWELEE